MYCFLLSVARRSKIILRGLTVCILLWTISLTAQPIVVSTLAGPLYPTSYLDSNIWTNTSSFLPVGVAVDVAGNLYMTDGLNHRIQKITPQGAISTLAGFGAGYADGMGTRAKFNSPIGVAVDAAGNVYVADSKNHRIRKISPTGIVFTLAGSGEPDIFTGAFADGIGTRAKFNKPVGVAVDVAGNVYVADENNHRIRKINPSGDVSTLAGTGKRGYVDGIGESAMFNSPYGVAVDVAGNVYVADADNHCIRKISLTGDVSTFAGKGKGYADGTGGNAMFNSPCGVSVDAGGNVYVADSDNHCIRKISPSGDVSTLIRSEKSDGSNGFGVDGLSDSEKFFLPVSVSVDASGNLYLADKLNRRIQKVSSEGVLSTFAGQLSGYANGAGGSARFNDPISVAADVAGNVYVADRLNHCIRKISSTGAVSTLAGSGKRGYADGEGEHAMFNAPNGVAVDAAGNVYVADENNHRIRKISPEGMVSTLAGSGGVGVFAGSYLNGPGMQAMFSYPSGVAVDANGNVFVADKGNARIRKISPAGVVSFIAGSGQGYADGISSDAAFDNPCALAVDTAGNVYVTDADNNRIRKISPSGEVTTLAGSSAIGGYANGTRAHAMFNTPCGVAVDSAGNVYVADGLNHCIRKITPDGFVSTLAGSGEQGYADGAATSVMFNYPSGVAVDAAGNIYVADASNNRIRKIRF